MRYKSFEDIIIIFSVRHIDRFELVSTLRLCLEITGSFVWVNSKLVLIDLFLNFKHHTKLLGLPTQLLFPTQRLILRLKEFLMSTVQTSPY